MIARLPCVSAAPITKRHTPQKQQNSAAATAQAVGGLAEALLGFDVQVDRGANRVALQRGFDDFALCLRIAAARCRIDDELER